MLGHRDLREWLRAAYPARPEGRMNRTREMIRQLNTSRRERMHKPTITALRSDLVAEAQRLGFGACGIAPAERNVARAEALDAWLDAGMHGSMEWMAVRSTQRRSPQDLWPEARSVIALGMSYAPAADPLALAGASTRGRISAYAQGTDYHDTVKKALKALARWLVAQGPARGLGEIGVKVFTDTAPVMEKPLAADAGIGWQGKHTNVVSREHGSWLFLGEIYTTLAFEPDAPARDRCGSCHACQDACPTGAFPAPYRLDARRCISYLTIEHAGPVPHELREGLGNRIYGCDDCLAVCPWNKFAAAASANRAFLPRAELAAPKLAELLALDDAGFRRLFSGSPIKRIGRNRFVRNCLYAAGNSGDAGLLAAIEPLRRDADPVVAEAADWALGVLGKR
jgi:epoxyqueuosine reductase